MENPLLQASANDDVSMLHHLLSNNTYLLDHFTLTYQHETTPLHIAAQGGHERFVDEILRRKPQMGRVQNTQGMLPVHLAAASGYWKIVAMMLDRDAELGAITDRKGRTVAHLAAACGKVGVLEMLRQRDDHQWWEMRTPVEKESILHTSVKHNQLAAVKVIFRCKEELVHWGDADGNTPLHLAYAGGNLVIADYLIKNVTDKNRAMSAVNSVGQLPANVTEQSKIGCIRRSITRVPSYGGDTQNQRTFHTFGVRGLEQKLLDQEYIREKQNTILVVATVIAGATFQTGIEHAKEHAAYRFFNTLSFGLSVVLFLVLGSGGSLRHWIQTRIVLLILWASLFFMSLAYGAFILRKSDHTISKVGLSFLLLLILGMLLVLVGHLNVLVTYLLNKFKHRVKSRREAELTHYSS